MSLAERLSEAPRNSRGVCRISWVLDQLSNKDKAALLAAMAVPVGDPDRIASTDIGQALRAEGFDVHNKTIETHRKGACSCESGRAAEA